MIHTIIIFCLLFLGVIEIQANENPYKITKCEKRVDEFLTRVESVTRFINSADFGGFWKTRYDLCSSSLENMSADLIENKKHYYDHNKTIENLPKEQRNESHLCLSKNQLLVFEEYHASHAEIENCIFRFYSDIHRKKLEFFKDIFWTAQTIRGLKRKCSKNAEETIEDVEKYGSSIGTYENNLANIKNLIKTKEADKDGIAKVADCCQQSYEIFHHTLNSTVYSLYHNCTIKKEPVIVKPKIKEPIPEDPRWQRLPRCYRFVFIRFC